MYPVVPPAYTPRSKGHVVNDIKECILCGICEKRCPTSAIIVDKPAETWTIDPFRCVQCLTCVRACPKACLHMDNNYTRPNTSMYTHTEKKPELTPEEKAAKEAKEREKAERIAAAKAVKEAKKASD
jgi:formate hydrogenlyase subunit 6/NADH:ubiquinone oxidoreductase subunit I